MSRALVNSGSEQAARGVGLLHKAFQILDLFSDDQPTWTQREICDATDLPRSTVSRLVRYLCQRGYLSFQTRSPRYTLGIAAIELGRRAQLHFDLTSIAIDVLEDIGRQTRETVMLIGFKPASLEVVCLHQIPSRHGGLRVFENVGATFPIYAGASAKPVLAHLPGHMAESVLDGPMPPVNPARIPDASALRKELEAVRKRGYAVSREETYPGVAGVGAALLNPGGFPLGSVAIAAPLQRMTDETISEYGRLLVGTVGLLNARLAGIHDDEQADTAAGNGKAT